MDFPKEEFCFIVQILIKLSLQMDTSELVNYKTFLDSINPSGNELLHNYCIKRRKTNISVLLVTLAVQQKYTLVIGNGNYTNTKKERMEVLNYETV